MAVMECPDCGGKVSDLAEHCPHCGRPVYVEDAQALFFECPDCDREVSDNARFCPNCGCEFDDDEPVQPAQPTVIVKPKEGIFMQTLNFGCFVVLIFIAVFVFAMMGGCPS